MRLRHSAWIAIGTAIIAICSGIAFSAPPTSEPDSARMRGASRTEKDGWIFVHLAGSPDQVGYQHGRLLADEIADFLRVARAYFRKTTGREWSFYRKAAEEMLWPGVEDEYRREIDGIVAGASSRGVQVDRWDIVALNASEELPYYYVPWLDRREGKAPTSHAPGNCSAFIATGSYTKDGRIVIGHNNWTNYVIGTRWNIVFDIRPESGSRLMMDGLPGVIVSDDDFSINAAGIMVTETTITQFEGWNPAGKPEFSRARKAMQYSRSIDDFVRIMLDGNNGGYANDWLVGDNKTGEIARFELGLKNHAVERTKDGCYFGSNFPVHPKLIREETTFDVHNRASSPNARKTRWEQLVAEHRGRIDVELAKKMENDDLDVILNVRGADERTLCGRTEISPRGIPEWDWAPYYPGGTVTSKVADAALAEKLSFWAQIGHEGSDFLATPFLDAHPEYRWMQGLLRDMPCRPWSLFRAP